jgi:hypothetical protein
MFGDVADRNQKNLMTASLSMVINIMTTSKYRLAFAVGIKHCSSISELSIGMKP